MTAILSTISGQFSKSIFLAAFTPVVIFAILVLTLIEPLLPIGWEAFVPIAFLGTEWQVVVVLLIGIVLGNILYSLNIPIIRLYEGYPWRGIGGKLTAYRQRQLLDLEVRRERMLTLRSALPENDPVRAGVEQRLARLTRERKSDWPRGAAAVLPTRLGNVIRAFEHYPVSQYKMESITVWPRLIAKIDPVYATSIDDSKTAFDFMLNSSVLCALLAVLNLFVGVWFGIPTGSPWLVVRWVLQLIAFAGLAYFLYLASIGRARAWGNMVKGAYDLYRWDLLKQLGYDHRPDTKEGERELWSQISNQMLYGDSDSGPWAPSYSKVTFVDPLIERVLPNDIPFSVTRTVSRQDAKELIVSIRVSNLDENNRPAEKIIVRDAVPAGYDYKACSATISGGDVSVLGTNPYRFYFPNPLQAGQQSTLTYHAIRRSE